MALLRALLFTLNLFLCFLTLPDDDSVEAITVYLESVCMLAHLSLTMALLRALLFTFNLFVCSSTLPHNNFVESDNVCC